MAENGSGTAVGQKKRKLSKEQVQNLEITYNSGSMPDRERKKKIARDLGLSQKQVVNWFQNKRSREKTKLREKELEVQIHLLRDQNEQFKSQFVVMERQMALMSRESAVPWNPMGFTAGTSSMAAPTPAYLMGGGTVLEQANMFNNDHGVGDYYFQQYVDEQANMFNNGHGVGGYI